MRLGFDVCLRKVVRRCCSRGLFSVDGRINGDMSRGDGRLWEFIRGRVDVVFL